MGERCLRVKDVASGFIQAFVDATIFAFKAQIGVDVVPGKNHHLSLLRGTLVAVINFFCVHLDAS